VEIDEALLEWLEVVVERGSYRARSRETLACFPPEILVQVKLVLPGPV
jgi:phosphoribosyl-dephospho-CoA transferase